MLSVAAWCVLPLGCTRAEDEARTATPDTLFSTLLKAARTSRLHTTELKIHKLVTYSDESHLRGSLFSVPIDVGLKPGDRKVAIPIDVTVRASIDLSKLQETDVRRTGARLVITLPTPQVEVTAAQIDHSGVRQYVDPLRAQFSDKELTDIAHKGEVALLRDLDKAAIAERAQADARRVLLPLLRSLGVDGCDVEVRFREGFQTDSLTVIRK